MNQILLSIVLFLLIVNVKTLSIARLCYSWLESADNSGKGFYNLFSAFNAAKKNSPQGHFGVVKRLMLEDYQTKKWFSAIVKQLPLDVYAYNKPDPGKQKELMRTDRELYLMKSMGNLGLSPSFYSCEYNENNILMAQEVMYGDFTNPTVINEVLRKPPNELIRLITSFFNSLKVMFDNGYIHGDIKPGNLLANNEFVRKIFLIDFGYAQLINKEMSFNGYVYYLSPNKASGGIVRPQDDLYSACLTLSVIISSKDDILGMKESKGQLKRINRACFNSAREIIGCLPRILKNVEKQWKIHFLRLRKPDVVVDGMKLKDMKYFNGYFTSHDLAFIKLMKKMIDQSTRVMDYEDFFSHLYSISKMYEEESSLILPQIRQSEKKMSGMQQTTHLNKMSSQAILPEIRRADQNIRGSIERGESVAKLPDIHNKQQFSTPRTRPSKSGFNFEPQIIKQKIGPVHQGIQHRLAEEENFGGLPDYSEVDISTDDVRQFTEHEENLRKIDFLDGRLFEAPSKNQHFPEISQGRHAFQNRVSKDDFDNRANRVEKIKEDLRRKKEMFERRAMDNANEHPELRGANIVSMQQFLQQSKALANSSSMKQLNFSPNKLTRNSSKLTPLMESHNSSSQPFLQRIEQNKQNLQSDNRSNFNPEKLRLLKMKMNGLDGFKQENQLI